MNRKLCWCVMLSVWMIGCGASVNASYKADIDRKVSALTQRNASYPPSQDAEPMPLAVGQWVRLKTVDEEQRPGFMDYRIVGKDGDAFWVETSIDSYVMQQDTRMLVRFRDRSDIASYEVKEFVARNNGTVTEYPKDLLGMMKALWKPLLSNLVVRWTDLPRDDVRVIAGDFEGAYKQRTTVSFGPYEQTSDVWSHPAVPINGAVRSQGIDKPTSMELVDFGTEGATSKF